MKNKVLKISFVLILILLIVSLIASNVLAAVDIGGVTVDPKVSDTTVSKPITSISNIILGAIQIVGTAIAVGMLLILGIKYMSAAPDEKANIKQSMYIYIIGAVVLFAASNLVNIIYKFATETVKGS